MLISRHAFMIYARNFIFGVEDGLVSTIGLLSGIAIAGVPKTTILLTGVVLIFVEAFSMAAGSFLSERSTEESAEKHMLVAGVIMFFSYLIAGFIPLLPYIVMDIKYAFWTSIFLSLAALFILGIASAKFFQFKMWQSGLRTLIIGGIAIGVGIFAGNLVK